MGVYLDHAATTPLRPEARDAWLEATRVAGNASSIHGAGQDARRLLEDAREQVAAAVGCEPIEVVFTSGGTESVNLAVRGLWRARRAATEASGIVLPDAEHHATLDAVRWLEAAEQAPVFAVPVDEAARVSSTAFSRAVAQPGVALATVLAANNEVGSLQPLPELAMASSDAQVPLHVDAVGAFGHTPLSFSELRGTASGATGLTAMSVSAHKVGGPVGVGALVVSRHATLEPLLHGGGQQRGIRPGTQDVAGAAAFAIAARLAVAELAEESDRLAGLRERLEAGVRAAMPEAIVSGHGVERLPGHLHVILPGAQGDSLLLLLDMAGIAVSTGSACQAGVPEPSHVLLAMGADEQLARGALRFTLGRTTTEADIDAVLHALPAAYERARRAGLSSRRVTHG
ncbi:cysteine desulfurase [Microbacterium sp. LRZ72]|uniref:cysteine desulfurase family protein n=1 Tax=Microbacterium sp. LRZ72 TaxID=2942481 RepID=UPI0029A83A96|nr:cysteine desulfurase family protein [Microbacterium sp. LRZ72]MDX2375548.1 cysteine desulfurase [Microbacterium sp. LRZ72]